MAEDISGAQFTVDERIRNMKNDDKAYLRIKRLNTFIYVASHIFTMVLIFFIALVCKSITALFYLVLIIPTFFKVNSSFNQTQMER